MVLTGAAALRRAGLDGLARRRMAAVDAAMGIVADGADQRDAARLARRGAEHDHFVPAQRFGQFGRYVATRPFGGLRPVEGDPIPGATGTTAETDITGDVGRAQAIEAEDAMTASYVRSSAATRPGR